MTELLTPDDVARITGLSIHTVRAAVRAGELPASKLRGRIRIHPDDLATWVDENRIHPETTTLERPTQLQPRPPAPAGGSVRQRLRQARNAA